MALNAISIDELIRILEKNVFILKTESCNADINFKFCDKLEYFDKLLCNVTSRIQSLLYLSENYANNNLKQFVNKITGLWTSVNNQVYEKCCKIRVASRTRSGVPLSLLLEKMKEERSLMRELLHIHKNKYSLDHLVKCYALLNEIEELLTNLKDVMIRHVSISLLICNAFLHVVRKATNAIDT